MSSNKDMDKKNGSDSTSTMDRYYHDTESFLYRYRWWVVLVLAILLAYYLYCKKSEGTATTSPATSVGVSTGSKGVLGQGDLNLASPPIGDTTTRQLFRM